MTLITINTERADPTSENQYKRDYSSARWELRNLVTTSYTSRDLDILLRECATLASEEGVTLAQFAADLQSFWSKRVAGRKAREVWEFLSLSD